MIPLEWYVRTDMFNLNPPVRRGNKNVKYSRCYNDNNVLTFDTETTSIIDGDNKYSFVYLAMLFVNDNVYYMRDLNVFKQWLDKYDTPGTINVIYVHNLGFDFAFLQNVLDFDTVFARTSHKPIFARYKSWEFRCSYFLSQMSLHNVGKYYDLPHAKLIDGLDYRKRRHSKTVLTPLELKYAELDVTVLADYVKYMLKQNGGKYKKIPYTQTGFVRRFILENAKRDKQYYKLRDIVERTRPDLHLYEMFEKCYTGGYTHANFMAVSIGLYRNVKSYDISSSYPSVMCSRRFPVGRFKEICANYDYYLSRPEKYSCVGRFKLTNVHAKTDLCFISQHKVIRGTMVHGQVSNGRVYCADSLEIYLTNVDVDTVKMMYECTIEPLEMWAAKCDYLPKTIVKSILELYKNKTKLKGVTEQHALYLASKQMINSVYG